MEPKMNIVIHRSHAHAAPRLKAFATGLEKHGLKPKWADNGQPKKCDLAVMWSANNTAVMDAQQDAGADSLIAECGYIGGRFIYSSLGFNGLNGRADFLNDDVPNDRASVHAELMKPWRKSGTYIALMGQVAGDASLRGVDHDKWLQSTADALSRLCGLPVKFRPHPLSRKHPHGLETLGGTLEDCLDGARFVVTFNSNSGVDAVMAGVPTIALDAGSMAWAVSGHEITATPPRPDRANWLRRLSYCQWDIGELEDGTAWEHLKRKYD